MRAHLRNGQVMGRVSYPKKKEVIGRIVAVLDGEIGDRGLRLASYVSRVMRGGDIHEIIATGEIEALPGSRVDRVAYVAFVEVVSAGIIVVGDRLLIEERCLGKVIGFDETHSPNHLNLVVATPCPRSGKTLGLGLDQSVLFLSADSL